jgi:hypothetical protein
VLERPSKATKAQQVVTIGSKAIVRRFTLIHAVVDPRWTPVASVGSASPLVARPGEVQSLGIPQTQRGAYASQWHQNDKTAGLRRTSRLFPRSLIATSILTGSRWVRARRRARERGARSFTTRRRTGRNCRPAELRDGSRLLCTGAHRRPFSGKQSDRSLRPCSSHPQSGTRCEVDRLSRRV